MEFLKRKSFSNEKHFLNVNSVQGEKLIDLNTRNFSSEKNKRFSPKYLINLNNSFIKTQTSPENSISRTFSKYVPRIKTKRTEENQIKSLSISSRKKFGDFKRINTKYRLTTNKHSNNSSIPEAFTSKSFAREGLDLYPDWLSERPDFQTSVLATVSEVNIADVVSIPAVYRSEIEKEALFKWVFSVKFFSRVPSTIVKEICDMLIRCDYNPQEYVIRKGEIGDCCYIIYKGKAGIYLEHDVISSIFGSGEVIGDHALDTEKPRSADVKCLERLITFKLKKIDYDSALITIKKLEKHDNTKFLMGINFFKNLSFTKNQNISNYLIQKQFHPGDVLCQYGEERNTFFIIKTGEVLIETLVNFYQKNVWPTGNSNWKVREINQKHLVPIITLKSGMFFGETSVIGNTESLVKATCIGYVTALIINKDEFLYIFSSKDIKEILDCSYIELPSENELENKLLEEVKYNKVKDKALLDALEVDLNNLEGRDFLLNPRMKKLKHWIQNKKSRNLIRTKEMKKRIVAEGNSIIDLDSVSKLKRYNKSVKNYSIFY